MNGGDQLQPIPTAFFSVDYGSTVSCQRNVGASIIEHAIQGIQKEGRREPALHHYPYWMATAAKEALTKADVKTTLVDYEGGHGWRGGVFGIIRTGFTGAAVNSERFPHRAKKIMRRSTGRLAHHPIVVYVTRA